MKTLCVSCFVFGPVVFVVLWGMALCAISSSANMILRNGNWFLYLNCICFYVCMYLFNWVLLFMFIGRRSGPVVARVLDQRQRD